MLGMYGKWAVVVCTVLLCLGCGTSQLTPTSTCTTDSCPAGTECLDGKYCVTACTGTLKRCNLKCVDLQFDKLHCGACGKSCKSGEVCTQGVCKSAGDAIGCNPACPTGQTCNKGVCSCPEGEVDCNGTCVVLATSPKNCGACGNACGAGAICQQGKCSCQGGQSYCGGSCMDTSSSDQHCGACGKACGKGYFCDVGKCVCAGGKTDCSGACVDTNADTNHCGACGTVCLRSQSCDKGRCVCSSGFNLCGSGANASCVNLKTNPKHCGVCGTACSDKETCLGGKCVAFQTCTDGKADCGGVCADLNADSKNCGTCGTVCRSGETCVGGSCKVLQCKTGEIQCGNLCVKLESNSSHCGACHNSCFFDERCTNRQCSPLCKTGETACNGTCANLQSNSQHCGACGNACKDGFFCKQGKCTSYCTGNLTACFSGCVDLKIDRNNCGRCGTRCDTCTNGVCGCGNGKVNCNNECVVLAQDHKHCGACFKVCPGNQDCENSTCGTYTKNWYPDLDGDGFGDKNAKPFVGGRRKAPPGWVDNKLDCCDADAAARPDQFLFFKTPNKCKNFDYNCDGKETFKNLLPACACSKTIQWDTSKLNFTAVLMGGTSASGFRHGVINTKDANVTMVPPPANSSCELSQGDSSYSNSSTFTITDLQCNPANSGPQAKYGPFATKAKFPQNGSKNYIKFTKTQYKENCLFQLSGAPARCGDTSAWMAPEKTPSLGYNTQLSRVGMTNPNNRNLNWWRTCRNQPSMSYYQEVFLRGSLAPAATHILTPYPTKKTGLLECQ